MLKVFVIGAMFFVSCGVAGYAAADRRWAIDGRCMLTDSCGIPCPGYFGQPLKDGHCAFVGILHIDHGEYDGVKLDGVNFGYTGDFQEKCAPAGDNPGYAWTTYYLDTASSPSQREAIRKLLNEPTLANEWGKPTAFVDAPITLDHFENFGQIDKPCGGMIGQFALIHITPLTGGTQKDKPVVVANSAHRFFDNVILSKSSNSFYNSADHQFKLDGSSGECSHFQASSDSK